MVGFLLLTIYNNRIFLTLDFKTGGSEFA